MLTFTSDQYAGGPTFSVKFDRYDGDRAQFTWSICVDPQFPDGENTYSASDLRLGSGQEPSDVEALRALSDFFGAWVEARELGTPNSDCWNLFPGELWDVTSEWREFADDFNLSTSPLEGN